MVGGAAAFDKPDYERERQKIVGLLEEIAQLAIRYNLAVVDGGTNFGVMKLMGQTCWRHKYRFPLVGVAPSGVVDWNGNPRAMNYQQTWYGSGFNLNLKQLLPRGAAGDEAPVPLNDNHTAFVLVDANEWGDEVEMLAAVAHELAHGGRHLEVLINGGAIARRDITAYLRHGGQVVVIEGSGRFADELAQALRMGYSVDREVQAVLNTNRVHLFPIDGSPAALGQLLLSLGAWV
jgi:hypothetical protein